MDSGVTEGMKVAVIGAGTMGHGIAQVCAMAGASVQLVDVSTALIERGLGRIRSNLDEGVRRQKVTPALREQTLARLQGETEVPIAVGEADLVVEAIPEKLPLKVALFEMLGRHAPTTALLATNTSSISVSRLQEATVHPERMLGLHFFNPVHINALVEVVRGRGTAPTTIERALALVGALGKEAVLVNDSPGFATSRLGLLLGLEAMRMVEEGVAEPAAIDRAMELGYRHPMGPLRLSDLVGLDVRLDIARYLHTALGADHFRPPAILERMVTEGKLGRKTGAGFYQWDEGRGQ